MKRNYILLTILVTILLILAGCAEKPGMFRRFYGEAIHTYTPPSTPELSDFPEQFLVDDDTNLILSFEDEIVAPSGYDLSSLTQHLESEMCSIVTGANYACHDMNNNVITGSSVAGMFSNLVTGNAITGMQVVGAATNTLYGCRKDAGGIIYDHYTTISYPCSMNIGVGHISQRILGKVYSDPQTGTQALYSCYQGNDYFVGVGSCEGDSAAAANSGLPPILGYAYSSPQAYTVPVSRCRFNVNNERYLIEGTSCINPDTTLEKTFYVLPICSETDNGRDISLQGTTTFEQGTLQDTCDAGRLHEYYCDGSGLPDGYRDEYIDCPTGTSCIDGACSGAAPPPSPPPSISSAKMVVVVSEVTSMNPGGTVNLIPEPVCPGNMQKIGEIFQFHGRDNTHGRKWAFCTQGINGQVNTRSVNSAADAGPWTQTATPAACPTGMTALDNLIQHGYHVTAGSDSLNYVNMYSRVCLDSVAINAGTVKSCAHYSTSESGHCGTPSDLDCPAGETPIDVVISDPVYDAYREQRDSGYQHREFRYNRLCVDFTDVTPPPPPPLPFTPDFTVDKTFIYDHVTKKLNYTIIVRNIGDAMPETPGIVNLRDFLPLTHINAIDSITPAMTIPNMYAWSFEKFDNTNSAAYTSRNLGGIDFYSSDGVFIIKISVELNPTIANGINITNYVNLTVVYQGDTVYTKSGEASFIIAEPVIPKNIIIVETDSSISPGGNINLIPDPVCPTGMSSFGQIFEMHNRDNTWGRKWAFCAVPGISGIINTRSVNSAADAGPWTQTATPAACPTGMTALDNLIQHGYHVKVTSDRFNYVNMYSRVCISDNALDTGSVLSCSDAQTTEIGYCHDQPNALICPAGQESIDVLISDPVYDAYREQRGSGYAHREFRYNRVCIDYDDNFVPPIGPPWPNGFACTGDAECTSDYCNPNTNLCDDPPTVTNYYRISIPTPITPPGLSAGGFTSLDTVLIGSCNDNGWVATALGATECAGLTTGRALILLQHNPYRLIVAGDNSVGAMIALNVLTNPSNYNLHGPRVDITYSGTTITVSFPHCSDNVQNYGETGIDCGGFCTACTTTTYPSATPGGGPSGGRGTSWYDQQLVEQEVTDCYDDWICTGWSECRVSGLQTRTCNLNDYPECSLIIAKPSEEQSCIPPYVAPTETCFDGIQNQGEEEIDCGGPCLDCPSKAWILPVVAILIILAIGVGFYVYYLKFLKTPETASPLRKYVKAARGKKIPDPRIRQILRKQGWSPEKINTAMK